MAKKGKEKPASPIEERSLKETQPIVRMQIFGHKKTPTRHGFRHELISTKTKTKTDTGRYCARQSLKDQVAVETCRAFGPDLQSPQPVGTDF